MNFSQRIKHDCFYEQEVLGGRRGCHRSAPSFASPALVVLQTRQAQLGFPETTTPLVKNLATMTRMTQETQLGTITVDARGRVYLRRLIPALPPNTIYMASVDDPENPTSLRLRLVEGGGHDAA